MTSQARIQALPRNRLLGEFSIWSAQLLRLQDELSRIESHADLLHIDVADGHFAPALLFFPDLVAAIRKASQVPIHVHLMVADDVLLAQIDQFADAGADLVSLHVENSAMADEALHRIAHHGMAAGLVLKVDTPVRLAQPYLSGLAMLTLLGTAIGVKGQGLNEHAPARLTQAKAMIAEAGLSNRILLAADGGIRDNTVPVLRAAGAQTVVLGSLAFNAPDLAARMAWLHGL
jgi:ribulose-phosphate 3-epimerase